MRLAGLVEDNVTSGQPCSHEKVLGTQPMLYSLVSGQPDGLYQWKGCYSPRCNSVNRENDFETIA